MWRALESGRVEQSDASHLFGFDSCLRNEIVPFAAKMTSVEMKDRIGRCPGRLCGMVSCRKQDAPRERCTKGAVWFPGSSRRLRKVARTIIYASPPPETCVRLLCHSSVRRAVRRSARKAYPLLMLKSRGCATKESMQDPQQPRPAQYGNVSMLLHVAEFCERLECCSHA